MTPRMDWWAFHVFLFDPAQGEACLLEDIMPALRDLLAQGRVSSWFFIRYWEGGPHLRVRLAGIGPEDRAALLERVRAHAAMRCSATTMTREDYYAGHPFDGEPVDVEALPWYGDGRVVEINYVPEVDRYGGLDALQLNETVFRASSDLAVNLVAATRTDFDKRMGVGFILLVAAATAVSDNGAGIATFCEHYARMWARHSVHSGAAAESALPIPSSAHVSMLARVLAGQPLPGAFAQRWQEILAQLRKELDVLGEQDRLISPLDGMTASTPERIAHAVVSILWSQLHMLNNRLAILPMQEVVLARMVAAAAREALAEEADAT